MWITYLAFLAVLPIHEILNVNVGFTLKLFNVFILLCLGALSLRVLFSNSRLRRTSINWWLAAFFGACLISLIAASNSMGGIRMLFALAFMYGAFYITINSVTDPDKFMTAIRVSTYSAFVFSLFGIFEVVGFLLGYNTGVYFKPGEAWFPRLKSTMQEPAYFANFLLLVFPLLLCWWVNGNRSLFGPRWRMLILLSCIFAAIILTVSKGTLLALAVLFPVCFLGRSFGFAIKRITLVALVASIPAASIFLWLVNESMKLSVEMDIGKLLYESFLNTDQGSYSERKDANATSWEMFLDNPILGVGIGNYGENYESYKPADANTAQNDVTLTPNNIVLNLLAENGVLGLALFSGMLSVLIVKCRRCLKPLHPGSFEHATVLGLLYGIGAMLTQYLFSAYFYFPHFWVLLGLLVVFVEIFPTRPTPPGLPHKGVAV
jgi:O-antigen ligase